MPPDEFPSFEYSLDNAIEAARDVADVSQMIQKVAFCASKEAHRYNINGVHINFTEDSLDVVAIDGKRMAIVQGALRISKNIGVTIPIQAADILPRCFNKSDRLNLQVAENAVSFADDRTTIISRTIEEDYPDYHKIIPTDSDLRIVVETEQLLLLLRREMPLTNPMSALGVFEIGGGVMRVRARSDIGEAKDEIDVEGDAVITIGLDLKLLLEALSHIDNEKIVILFKDAMSAIVIQPVGDERYQYIQMPMRLQEGD